MHLYLSKLVIFCAKPAKNETVVLWYLKTEVFLAEVMPFSIKRNDTRYSRILNKRSKMKKSGSNCGDLGVWVLSPKAIS